MDDTQDQQNDITSSDNSENTESSEPEIKSGQVFDISDDNISPASNTEEDESIPIVSTPVHNMVPQKISSTPIKNITPPQVIPKVIPITQPIPTPTPAIQTPPPIRPFTGSMSNLEMEIGSLIPKSLKSKENPFVYTPPTPTEKTETKPSYNQKNIRTYEGDVANVLAHTKTSTTSIAIAESQKAQGSDMIGSVAPNHSIGKLIIILLSLILIGGGVFGAYYFYSKSPFAQTAPIIQEEKIISLIPADIHTSIAIDNLGQAGILSRIKQEISKPIPADSIKNIVLIRTDSSTISSLSALDILGVLNIDPPDILTRTLTPQWMLGVYSNDNSEKGIFVVVTTNYFQNAFSGMLQWEKVMPDDLKQYLFTAPPEGIANNEGQLSTSTKIISEDIKATATSTSTATTTTKIIPSEIMLNPYTTIQGQFEDRIIKNKDVRAFKISNGDTLFLYSFIDNSKLVITDKEETLTDILGRLEKQTFMR